MTQVTNDQGRALAKGTLRKEKPNKTPITPPWTQKRTLPPPQTVSQHAYSQARMQASGPYTTAQSSSIQSRPHGATPRTPVHNAFHVSPQSVPESGHANWPTRIESIRPNAFEPSEVNAASLSKLTQARIDNPLPPTPLVVKMVVARKPVAVTPVEPQVASKAQIYKPITPAAAAGRAAFALSDKRTQEWTYECANGDLAGATHVQNTDMGRNPAPAGGSTFKSSSNPYYQHRNPAPVGGSTFKSSSNPYYKPKKDCGKAEPNKLASGVIDIMNADSFLQAKYEALEKSNADKQRKEAIARALAEDAFLENNRQPGEFHESSRPEFYSTPYTTIPKRSESSSSRNSTSLSAVGSFIGKVVHRTAEMIEKRPRLRSRAGSANSITSIFGGLFKDEDTKAEERREHMKSTISCPLIDTFVEGHAAGCRMADTEVQAPLKETMLSRARQKKEDGRKQKLKGTISHPHYDTLTEGADAFDAMERTPVRGKINVISSPYIAMSSQHDARRETSLGDFLPHELRLPPPPPIPRFPGANSMPSKFPPPWRRDSDASFGCRGIEDYHEASKEKSEQHERQLPPPPPIPRVPGANSMATKFLPPWVDSDESFLRGIGDRNVAPEGNLELGLCKHTTMAPVPREVSFILPATVIPTQSPVTYDSSASSQESSRWAAKPPSFMVSPSKFVENPLDFKISASPSPPHSPAVSDVASSVYSSRDSCCVAPLRNGNTTWSHEGNPYGDDQVNPYAYDLGNPYRSDTPYLGEGNPYGNVNEPN